MHYSIKVKAPGMTCPFWAGDLSSVGPGCAAFVALGIPGNGPICHSGEPWPEACPLKDDAVLVSKQK